MTGSLIHGDHVSCSRLGGTMRCESARLRRSAQSLVDALSELPGSEAPGATETGLAVRGATTRAAITLAALRATADDLDEAGAALQRYATDLAEGHELGRRAERRVEGAGLLLQATRVTEPWGPASAQEAGRRLAQVPEVQSRVDLATAHVGRARGRLQREMARLTQGFSAHSLDARRTRQAPVPSVPPVSPVPPVPPRRVRPTKLSP
jgi:hypothetical protein